MEEILGGKVIANKTNQKVKAWFESFNHFFYIIRTGVRYFNFISLESL